MYLFVPPIVNCLTLLFTIKQRCLQFINRISSLCLVKTNVLAMLRTTIPDLVAPIEPHWWSTISVFISLPLSYIVIYVSKVGLSRLSELSKKCIPRKNESVRYAKIYYTRFCTANVPACTTDYKLCNPAVYDLTPLFMIHKSDYKSMPREHESINYAKNK